MLKITNRRDGYRTRSNLGSKPYELNEASMKPCKDREDFGLDRDGYLTWPANSSKTKNKK